LSCAELSPPAGISDSDEKKPPEGGFVLNRREADYFDAAEAAEAAEVAAEAAESAAEAADEAAEEAASAAGIAGAGAGLAMGAGAGLGVTVVVSSFLLQAARATEATREANRSDFFIFVLNQRSNNYR
jgi:hypothetical protein